MILFLIISGAVFGAVELIQHLFSGSIDHFLLYVLHTVAAWLLLTKRDKKQIIPHIFAELFSVSMIVSMRTAVFSVTKGAERSFVQLTLLYIVSDLIAVLFILF